MALTQLYTAAEFSDYVSSRNNKWRFEKLIISFNAVGININYTPFREEVLAVLTFLRRDPSHKGFNRLFAR